MSQWLPPVDFLITIPVFVARNLNCHVKTLLTTVFFACVCAQVKVWDIPPHGLLKNLTVPWKELQGHSRRVGLIEWHPTANNILFSTAYDYQVRRKACTRKQ